MTRKTTNEYFYDEITVYLERNYKKIKRNVKK